MVPTGMARRQKTHEVVGLGRVGFETSPGSDQSKKWAGFKSALTNAQAVSPLLCQRGLAPAAFIGQSFSRIYD